MRKPLTIALAFTLGLLVTACNTVQGAGADVESAGKAVKDTAREAK